LGLGEGKKDKSELYDFLLKQVKVIVAGTNEVDRRLFSVCSLLQDFVPFFDWVGFYLVDKAKAGQLVLGPFAGKPTDHLKIEFGKGICGQVAKSEETLVVQDVSKSGNYLSCAPEVKSEIVIPMFKNGKFAGELDIDSETLSPFDDKDRRFLEAVAKEISAVL